MNTTTQAGRTARRTVRQASAKSHKRKKSPLRLRSSGPSSGRQLKPPAFVGAGGGSALPVADDSEAIVEHPDGFHWVAPDGKQEFGPFETRELARADRDRYSEQAPTPGETLQEAEREIGIADWIDPETGEPAEGQSPPYLEEE